MSVRDAGGLVSVGGCRAAAPGVVGRGPGCWSELCPGGRRVSRWLVQNAASAPDWGAGTGEVVWFW